MNKLIDNNQDKLPQIDFKKRIEAWSNDFNEYKKDSVPDETAVISNIKVGI